MRFTKIPESTFNDLQVDAGVLLKAFDPQDSTYDDTDIICATTGGIQVTATPTYSDYGEDIDNCPVNTLELKRLDGWECSLSTTSLSVNEEVLKQSLGAADSSEGVIKLRRDVKTSDFKDIWWVGDKGDGGYLACCLKNALSTGGFSLQTTKNGKGQISLEFTGHVSIDAQDEMPLAFYLGEPDKEDEH